MDLLASGVPWFPQEYAATFYWAKGLLSLVATLLVVAHMNTAFADEVMSRGRRMRYYALLIAATVLTAGSAEQLKDGVVVSYRNFGGMFLAAFITAAMVVSIAESRRKR